VRWEAPGVSAARAAAAVTARVVAATVTAAAARAAAERVAAARAAGERVVEVVEEVEVMRLMGATSLIQGWAVARPQRARMLQRAVRSSRR
jgi:hypothetical protein